MIFIRKRVKMKEKDEKKNKNDYYTKLTDNGDDV
jgi:hypothetical protein